MRLVYFSGASEYTHRFVGKVTQDATRIPLDGKEITVDEDYLLAVPTYGNGSRKVPPQVIRFLAQEDNRKHLKGVIGVGNTNFNADYCAAATAISRKCQVPVLHRLELLGTPNDVTTVSDLLGATTR